MTLRTLWDDIRPSAVYAALTTILVSTWTGIVIVTHGLKWWQQAILAFLTALLCVWAGVATYMARKQIHQQIPPPEGKINAPKKDNPQTLLERVDTLAKGIFGFLRECGEEKIPSLTYVVKVHSGFMLYWFPRVEEMEHELGFAGIWAYEYGELIRLYRNAWSYDTIGKVAEALLEIRNKMELKEYKNQPLTQEEVDQMSSTEMRRRIETDPDFSKQMEILEAFKRPSR
jgi:hypothetical protein